MEDQQRKFEGIWIHKDLWLSTDFTLQEKVMILEIDSLDNEKGCYASNDYFAKFFNLSKARVSQIITNLNKKGIITIEYIYKGKEVDKRILHINQSNLIGIKYSKGGIKFSKCNNIYINNTNNIDKSILLDNIEKKELSKEDKILKENIKCIIDYLNDSIGSNYRYDTKGTISLIKARFKDGYKLDDFYDVIDKKVKEWNNSEMQIYLRPTTLFGNKFENYLQSKSFNGKPKTSYSSRPSFDNTINHEVPKGLASMDEKEKEEFKNTLAKDENGNLIKF